MLRVILFSLIYLQLSCSASPTDTEKIELSISSNVDTTTVDNKIIIATLKSFLIDKDDFEKADKYWVSEEIVKYKFPYYDLYKIESSKHGDHFFQPTLLEILPTNNPSQKILKLAYIGHLPTTRENQIKAVYNLMANINDKEVKFSRYLDYITKTWKTEKIGKITYKISPDKLSNKNEMEHQLVDVRNICEFLECNELPVLYYSCIHPVELFNIRGFEYHPMMYADSSGGFADHGNVVFSGNNSEKYTHEILHIYTSTYISGINKFLDEGLATYLGGSGKFDYKWHRAKFKKFLEYNPYNFSDHTDPYERLYFEKETPIPYVSAAVIIERTMRLYGKEKLLTLLNSTDDVWSILKSVGLNRENINAEIKSELNKEVFPGW